MLGAARLVRAGVVCGRGYAAYRHGCEAISFRVGNRAYQVEWIGSCEMEVASGIK